MIIGIDPGVTGAIVLLRKTGELVEMQDMPTTTLYSKKQQVNPYILRQIIEGYQYRNAGAGDEIMTAFLEQVSAMPGQGVTSMFNFGTGYGIVQGVLGGLHITYMLVAPPKWKKSMGLIGKEKDYARTLAQRLFPDADLSLKKHVGRADALLIARYGCQNLI